MLVGAFADAGADRDTISNALAGLATRGSIEWSSVKRKGMAASKFRVSVNELQKHRHLSGILKMIDAANLPDRVKFNVQRVFNVLAEAESHAHGVSVEKV